MLTCDSHLRVCIDVITFVSISFQNLATNHCEIFRNLIYDRSLNSTTTLISIRPSSNLKTWSKLNQNSKNEIRKKHLFPPRAEEILSSIPKTFPHKKKHQWILAKKSREKMNIINKHWPSVVSIFKVLITSRISFDLFAKFIYFLKCWEDHL